MWPFRKSDFFHPLGEPTAASGLEASHEELVALAVMEPQAGAKNELTTPEPTPAEQPELSDEEMDEYRRVSSGVGIDCCTDLQTEILLRCLRDENISTYRSEDVIAYLDKQLGTDWEWRGLRTQDAKALRGWNMSHGGSRKVSFADEPYRGAVPLPVLLTVEKIQRRLPEINFYVSARKDEDGDPFLMVTSQHLSCYIVERWDEPGFRER